MQLDLLAEEIHRSESELANEAVALYLAQAQRGEFVTDEEMEVFFTRYTDPQA